MSLEMEQEMIKKFKNAQGQLNKVVTMVDRGEYCIDIFQQSLAVIGLIKSAQQDLLEHHLHYCFKEAMQQPKRQEEMINELIRVLRYYNK